MKKKAFYRPELRTYVAHARMNEEEWKLFNSQAQKLGLSQSEFIRQAVFTAKVEVTIRPVYDSAVLDQIAAEYGKIGSNINQIARHFNSGGERSLAMQEEIERAIAELYALRKEVLRLAGDYSGSYQTHKKS